MHTIHYAIKSILTKPINVLYKQYVASVLTLRDIMATSKWVTRPYIQLDQIITSTQSRHMYPHT